MYGLNMGIGAAPWEEGPVDAKEFAFRALAAGGRFGFTARQQSLEMWTGWLKEQNRIHARILPVAGRRTILSRDAGVAWRRENDRLLFAYRPFHCRLRRAMRVCEVTARGERAVRVTDNRFLTKPWSVYRMADV